MRLSEAFPSRWLKAADADDGPLLLTISSVVMEDIKNDKGEFEPKLVVFFSETDKGLICNKTNGNTLGGHFGQDTDDWVGKRIALVAVEVQFGADMVPALRVSKKLPKAPAARPAPAPVKAAANPDGDELPDDDSDIPF